MDILSTLPKNQKIIITSRIKNLKKNTKFKYDEITNRIIDKIDNTLKPINIYVPTFNYDFLKLGEYDYYNSKSQVGRFSEEFRLNFTNNRNYDPIFSYTSLYKDNLNNKQWCSRAFENNSFFDNIENDNYLVINIDLPLFVSTFIHYLENKFRVPYRYEEKFHGRISFNRNIFNFDYVYFVRNLKKKSIYNSKKIKNFLMKKTVLKSTSIFDLSTDWYLSKKLITNISSQLKENNKFLID